MEWLTQQMERGLFSLYVLWLCRNRSVCGVDLVAAELQHGHRLSMGRLYPTLAALTRRGLLTVERRKEHGRIHKYYRTTRAGRTMLEEARKDLGEPMRRFLAEWLAGKGNMRRTAEQVPLEVAGHHST